MTVITPHTQVFPYRPSIGVSFQAAGANFGARVRHTPVAIVGSVFQLCGHRFATSFAAIAFGNIVCRSTARGDETSPCGNQMDISPLQRLY